MRSRPRGLGQPRPSFGVDPSRAAAARRSTYKTWQFRPPAREISLLAGSPGAARAILARAGAGDDTAARLIAYDSFEPHWPPEKRAHAGKALRDAARALLERIMNVDEGT